MGWIWILAHRQHRLLYQHTWAIALYQHRIANTGGIWACRNTFHKRAFPAQTPLLFSFPSHINEGYVYVGIAVCCNSKAFLLDCWFMLVPRAKQTSQGFVDRVVPVIQFPHSIVVLIKAHTSFPCWLTQLKQEMFLAHTQPVYKNWNWESSRTCRWGLSEHQHYECFLFIGSLTSAQIYSVFATYPLGFSSLWILAVLLQTTDRTGHIIQFKKKKIKINVSQNRK